MLSLPLKSINSRRIIWYVKLMNTMLQYMRSPIDLLIAPDKCALGATACTSGPPTQLQKISNQKLARLISTLTCKDWESMFLERLVESLDRGHHDLGRQAWSCGKDSHINHPFTLVWRGGPLESKTPLRGSRTVPTREVNHRVPRATL